MAECRRIDPNHVGPHCGCAGDACALDAPRPTSELAADVPAIARRWHTYHGRGAHDYTDAGCRILAEHAFRDMPALVARVTDLETRLQRVSNSYASWQLEAKDEKERLERVADNLVVAADVEKEKREAAEAHVAALTQERDEAERLYDEAEIRYTALEAALATTRQALTWIAQTSPDRTAARAARRALAETEESA